MKKVVDIFLELWYTNQAVERGAHRPAGKGRATEREQGSRRASGTVLENDIEKNEKKEQSDSEERNAVASVGADVMDKD